MAIVEYGPLKSWDVGPVMEIKGKYAFRIALAFENDSTVQQKGGFPTKKVAKKARDVVVAELHNGEYVFYPKVTVDDLLQYWMQNKIIPYRASSTVYGYSSRIRCHISPVLGKSLVNDLTQAKITSVIDRAQSKGLAQSLLSILRTALTYAKGIHVISRNPLLEYRMPKSKKQAEDKHCGYHTIAIDPSKTLSIQECISLLEAAKGTSLFLPIAFSLCLGLRRGEMYGVKYADINFFRKEIHISRQLGRDWQNNAVESKMLSCQPLELKTKSSDRIVEIPDFLFDAILQEREKYLSNQKKYGNEFRDLDYIICSDKGKPRCTSYVSVPFKRLLQKCNLKDIRWHDLRHTYATILYRQQVSIKTISTALGHATQIVTEKVYIDKSAPVLQNQEAFENFIQEVLPETAATKGQSILFEDAISELIA